MNINDIYTPLEEAKKELERRWGDKDLEKKVYEFLKGNVPEILKKEPRFLMIHQLITPDNEFNLFIDTSIKIGLKPLCLEYLEDNFVTTNINKIGLAKAKLIDRFNKKTGEIVFKHKKVISLASGNHENRTFNELETVQGEKLVNFHHRILKERFSNIDTVDISYWIKSFGPKSNDWYPYYLALFIRNGIVFENYIEDGKEGDFTKKILIPHFLSVTKHFGVKPLIVEGVPKDQVNDTIWRSYPKYMDDFFKEI